MRARRTAHPGGRAGGHSGYPTASVISLLAAPVVALVASATAFSPLGTVYRGTCALYVQNQ